CEVTVALEGQGLVRRFGGVCAVDDATVAVHTGEIVGLIGSNGAGKTTIVDLLSGHLPADSGRVVFDGLDVTEWSADARSRAGLGRSFPDARLFPSLSVAETIAVALDRHLEVRDPVSP